MALDAINAIGALAILGPRPIDNRQKVLGTVGAALLPGIVGLAVPLIIAQRTTGQSGPGTGLVAVPDLVGSDQAAAITSLNQLQLKAKVNTATSTDAQKNKLKKRLQAREKELKEALKRVEAALRASDPSNTAIEFKRQMGSDHAYAFKSSGQRRKPEELSAEILKSLRGDVEQRTGEIIEAAVITVPAAFELHQCDATRKAAELAGFKQSPLVQEPVAAALAYGFDLDSKKAYWLVFDFGGGTFDAAVMRSEEGTIHVVDHGGDNFLGGSNIDFRPCRSTL